MTNWNELAAIHHAAMVANGFHEKYSHTDLLLRGIEEVGEATKAWRKNRRADMVGFCAGVKVPNIYEIAIKHSIEEELADIACIMMDFAATNDIKITYSARVNAAKIEQRLMDTANFILVIYKELHMWETVDMERIESCVKFIFTYLYALAEEFNIDLQEQVKLKMEYNKTREYRHGDKN